MLLKNNKFKINLEKKDYFYNFKYSSSFITNNYACIKIEQYYLITELTSRKSIFIKLEDYLKEVMLMYNV